jgi:hypothetical protein
MDVISEELHIIFDKHWTYTASHVVTGMISVWYPFIGVLFLVYQLLQLSFNKRFFLFTMELKEENNPRHTAMKIVEFGVGFVLAWIFRKKLI